MGYTGPGGEDYLYPGSRGILSTVHWILDPFMRKVVRLGRDVFLEAVERVKPEVIYRIERTHRVIFDAPPVIFLVDTVDEAVLRRVSPHTYDYVDDTRITKGLFDKLWTLLEEEQKQTRVRP